MAESVPFQLPKSPPPRPNKFKTATTKTISSSQLSSRFLEAKTEAGYPSKTISGYQDTHNLLLEVVGDRPVDSITHQEARYFIQVLKRLPVNRAKSYPQWSVKRLLQLDHQQLLSHKTILKHTERVSALFN